MTDEPHRLSVVMGSTQRRGAWQVPEFLAVRVLWGDLELDLREAVFAAPLTTIEVEATMSNLEIVVPPHLAVAVEVQAHGSNVEDHRHGPAAGAPRVRITGRVKLSNFEIVPLAVGEPRPSERPRGHGHGRRERHRQRWRELHAEREMWHRSHAEDGRWRPWWLMARMRRRIFSWLALAFAGGIAVGVYAWPSAAWWHILVVAFVLSMVSGAIAWRLTRPLLMAVRAARDLGDGKLDTRIDASAHGGEVRLLAVAINDMAAKLQQQMVDQRQLLAAVSHELRTPLGHMRVLIETARDQGSDARALGELEREVLVLDDLVGRLLASSRLEFGTLDRRPLDLGELVTDVATSAGIAPEMIEAIGDVIAPTDPTLVRRAVANLIDNARLHGGGAVAVRIERRAGQVAIEVDDAGPGVAAERRADAFRAFVPSSGGGLGLGLALVSRIAVAHGGGAWVTDRPGGGARVGFTVGTTRP